MTRFDRLQIGDFFLTYFPEFGFGKTLYEKKSLSSAYAINPDTEERIRRVGFSGAVIVVQVYAQ